MALISVNLHLTDEKAKTSHHDDAAVIKFDGSGYGGVTIFAPAHMKQTFDTIRDIFNQAMEGRSDA